MNNINNFGNNFSSDYVFKNLLFFILFVAVASSSVFYFLLPEISGYKEQNIEYKKTNLIGEQVDEDAKRLDGFLQKSKQDNKKILDKLRYKITNNDIYAIGTDYFSELSILKTNSITQEHINIDTYELKGKVIHANKIVEFLDSLNNAPFVVNLKMPVKVERLPKSEMLSFVLEIQTRTSAYIPNDVIKQYGLEYK